VPVGGATMGGTADCRSGRENEQMDNMLGSQVNGHMCMCVEVWCIKKRGLIASTVESMCLNQQTLVLLIGFKKTWLPK
jgi:hypothetical protein